jgi:hypothetical protein
VPEIAGRAVFAGATPATWAVASDEADAEPMLFDAVTTTRIVVPTSPEERL